jgi:hypothetical protein
MLILYNSHLEIPDATSFILQGDYDILGLTDGCKRFIQSDLRLLPFEIIKSGPNDRPNEYEQKYNLDSRS